jgi:hypothetical protein
VANPITLSDENKEKTTMRLRIILISLRCLTNRRVCGHDQIFGA